MQIIGFNFTKITSEKSPDYQHSTINTDIKFTNVEKESVEMLKDAEAIKLSFTFSINYEEPQDKDKKSKKKPKKYGSVDFAGQIILSATEQEAKDFEDSWKEKQVPKSSVVPLYNFLLKKCSTRALQLEEDLNLPPHIPFPQVSFDQNQQQNQ
ncbi:hypothetical protein CMI47_05785 [Candidatus Pacearchaeota archaeon]|nr:hypothetical protein [Candidatus Pacearchaeota archaeon]|tara:strand:- start:405 stop:863 length:459 start_codon:yes stop_codon:yes gene_type:complete